MHTTESGETARAWPTSRYTRRATLRRGDAATSYAATDEVMGGRPVLVVEMAATRSRTDGPLDQPSPFRTEARRLATLRHPNLASVTDWFEDGDRAWLVTSLPQGESLPATVARRRVTLLEATAWIDDVAAALEYLHAQQPPLHMRLLDPANIIIDDGGHAVVSGFDLSHTLDAAPHLNRPLRAGGEAAYGAPEVRGGGAVDARADVYALGALMYFLFTGQAPPSATEARATSGPRAVHGPVPPPLERLVQKAMAINKTERFADARELRRALARVRQETDLSAPVGACGAGAAPVRPEAPQAAEVVTPMPGPVSMRNPRVFTDEAIQAEMDRPAPRPTGGGGALVIALVVVGLLVAVGGTWYVGGRKSAVASTTAPAATVDDAPSAPPRAAGSSRAPQRGPSSDPALSATLYVMSDPAGAFVWIDDNEATSDSGSHITPLTIPVTPGRHKLRLEKDGAFYETTVPNILKGQTRRVSGKLERPTRPVEQRHPVVSTPAESTPLTPHSAPPPATQQTATPPPTPQPHVDEVDTRPTRSPENPRLEIPAAPNKTPKSDASPSAAPSQNPLPPSQRRDPLDANINHDDPTKSR